MKFFYVLLLLFPLCSSLFAQEGLVNFEDSYTENTTGLDKFRMCLDTLDKYFQRDNRVVKQVMKECQRILEMGIVIEEADHLEYGTALILAANQRGDAMKAFEYVEEYKQYLDGKDIPYIISSYFKYISAYTSMVIGDDEQAQISFYGIIEEGKEEKDTLGILGALFSLGQMYSESEGDYESALDYFNQFIALSDLMENKKNRKSDYSLIRIGLSHLYIEQEKYDVALKLVEEAIVFNDANNITAFNDNFLLKKSQIAIGKKDFESAQKSQD